MSALAVLSRVDEIVIQIKQMVEAYERWTHEGDISAHRRCPRQGCGCRFRHRHGWTARAVVCGGLDRPISLLRLYCPECGETEALCPEWLRSHSPYPWPWQEAAMLQYVEGPAGYRPVAAAFGVDYTVLWGWVRSVVMIAVDLVAVVTRELLEQDKGAELQLVPVAHEAVLHKARTPEKRQGLAHLPLLSQAAEALRAACRRRAELPEEDTTVRGALGWLGRYLPVHDVPSSLWLQSHRNSHSVSVPAPP